MSRRTLLSTLAVLALLAGCGTDHSDHQSAGGGGGSGNATDAAFVGDMVPHHEGAIEMAELARTSAEHDEIKQLADDIIASQQKEIETMESVAGDLGDEHQGGHMSGDDHDRGMHMDPAELRGAEPFDREFIDMMIPHHEGAVTMAEEELEKGENPELRKLAEDIIAAQEREIAQMREWRSKWYGNGG